MVSQESDKEKAQLWVEAARLYYEGQLTWEEREALGGTYPNAFDPTLSTRLARRQETAKKKERKRNSRKGPKS